jgi:quercetin dioxygenase-like cupin family protein
MKRGSKKVDIDRRAVLMLGLAGASALFLGKGRSVLAAESKVEETAKGVRTKVFKEAESMIPGFPKVRLRAVTFQPGGKLEARTMKNPMICECSQGSLEVTQDSKTFTAQKGDIWTCKEGTVEGDINKGKTPAVMRLFDLLPA